MNVAFNPGINYGTMYRSNINKPIKKMETPTTLPQTNYYKNPIPSVFHSKEDYGVGETYLNCALSGSEDAAEDSRQRPPSRPLPLGSRGTPCA